MKALIIICIVVTWIISASYRPPQNNQENIDSLYLKQLDTLSYALTNLQKCIIYKSNNTAPIQQAFLKLRIAYKKIAVITDYLNPYETFLLNNPPVERSEDDNPDIIIRPQGLQLMEAVIWNDKDQAVDSEALLHEIEMMHAVIEKLKTEPGRINKFTNENTWQAMRLSLITLITKTITSFDSPVSLNGIAESKATLESFYSYLQVYRNEIERVKPGAYKNIIRLTEAGMMQLNASPSFIQFDRLGFIRDRINPLSETLTAVAVALNYAGNNERRPLNAFAKNIFAANAFDIDFFSPNNRNAATKERILLGKSLFSDTRLSSNGKRSCAGCHQPALAFTDGRQTALALDERSFLKRNTPTLLNAVYQTKQFYDSRQTMLEFQVNNVVHNEAEMGGSTEQLAKLIREDSNRYTAFALAYPGENEPVSRYTIANAIASYIRSLQSLNSRFDQYMRNEDVVFTASEKNGFNLFMGKAKCGTCHFMPLFNGLAPPAFNDTESEVLGVPASLKKPYRLDSDSGKYYFTGSAVHLFAFKTPTLRNIALTAPYMHNGVYSSLESVIDFYNNGGGKGLGIAPVNQSLPFDRLQLTRSEKKDLIRFLETLTDTTSYQKIFLR